MLVVNPAIFKSYDIRALVPQELNEEIAYRVGRVFANQGETHVVGRDMRTTSPALAEAVARGLMESGVNVIDVGLVSTPTFYYAVRTLPCEGGLQITASHNPAEYNGIKMVRRSGNDILKIGKGFGIEAIRDAVLAGAPERLVPLGWRRPEEGVAEKEVEAALGFIVLPEKRKSLRVAADAGNGMGACYLEALFDRLGLQPEKLFFKLDGKFPNHPADPLRVETLAELQRRVREGGFDLGIATDGDGDRVFFIDERGEIVTSSVTTALVASELLREHPGEKILVDSRYIRNAFKAIKEAGGLPSLCRAGHAHISAQLRKDNGLFAGESSGHYFFRWSGFAEEPLLVILIIFRALLREQKPFSEILAPLRSSAESGEINFYLSEQGTAVHCLAVLKEKYGDGEQSEIDGLAVTYPDWRFSVRAANTEPLLRLNVEGATASLVAQKKGELTALIKELCRG